MTSRNNANPIALSIAGSDSSAGAGLQADLKTFSALRVYGVTVVTAITAQNTQGVQGVEYVTPAMIFKQMESLFTDLEIGAVKIGMVGNEAAIDAVIDGLKRFCGTPIVLDPVMVSTSGDRLLEKDAEDALRTRLMPMADLVTPNLAEAALLLSESPAANEAELRGQAERLQNAGAAAVLMKGGHAIGAEAVDILYDGSAMHRLSAPWIETRNTHGTGCTLSSAIAAYLAKGLGLPDAVQSAKAYLTAALAEADHLSVGRGRGPVHHFHDFWRKTD